MTDETSAEQPQDTQDAAPVEAAAPGGIRGNAKAILAGVGIGSAALVAALMYASKRPKRRG